MTGEIHAKSATGLKGRFLRIAAAVACPLVASSQVVPSAGTLATYSAATTSPVPARLSTTTGCPSAAPSPGELLTGWLDDLGGIVFDAKAAPGALRVVAA